MLITIMCVHFEYWSGYNTFPPVEMENKVPDIHPLNIITLVCIISWLLISMVPICQVSSQLQIPLTFHSASELLWLFK